MMILEYSWAFPTSMTYFTKTFSFVTLLIDFPLSSIFSEEFNRSWIMPRLSLGTTLSIHRLIFRTSPKYYLPNNPEVVLRITIPL